MSTPTLYKVQALRAFRTRARQWFTVGTYRNRNTATTIAYMIRKGKGLKAFEDYPPDTFETRIVALNGDKGVPRTVQFRKKV